MSALAAGGLAAELVRWNQPERLSGMEGAVIAGGWSYEDRIRAGVIAARDPIVAQLRSMADAGKPVLGICNGAQVLIEAGIVPLETQDAAFALAPNRNPFVAGYYCTWVCLRKAGKNGCFTALVDEVIAIPIAHGEGRFVSSEKGLAESLLKKGQVAFEYCDKEGNVAHGFPVNPNGSMANIAALTNEAGNAMAIMPHPERASFVRQLPSKEKGNFDAWGSAAPAQAIFSSMKQYLDQGCR